MKQLIQAMEKILQQRLVEFIDPPLQKQALSQEFDTIRKTLALLPFVMTPDEAFILALTLLLHISPHSLDLLLSVTKNLTVPIPNSEDGRQHPIKGLFQLAKQLYFF
ncbi:MAG: hypothetical protein LUD02_04230 [Tannerellaceae bacterium]|nr:hypothetical protein [Tannerellaceae bacterium]MCD8263454.1 hypothetical protein [Tannerellaceae bacterium]